MSVKFYLHTPIEDLNERRALCRVARLLNHQYQGKNTPHVLLIGNIEPRRQPRWRSHLLTQLDGIILTEYGVALLEFKNYPDPIDGLDADRPWRIRGMRETVYAGKSINPYQQAKHARKRWIPFLSQKTFETLVGLDHWEHLEWAHLQTFVLFYPFLHKESQLLHPGADHLWLNFDSTDDILDLLHNSSSNLCPTPQEMVILAEDVFGARPWTEINQLLQEQVGFLVVSEPDGHSQTAFRIVPFDRFSIGRSSQSRIQLDSAFFQVSGTHLIITSDERTAYAEDAGSNNGSWLNGKRLTGKTPLRDGDVILLGDGQGSCRIEFWGNRPNQGRSPFSISTDPTVIM